MAFPWLRACCEVHLLASQGCDKIISCVSARSDLTVDLKRVEEQGIQNLARAYMVGVPSLCCRLQRKALPLQQGSIVMHSSSREHQLVAVLMVACCWQHGRTAGCKHASVKCLLHAQVTWCAAQYHLDHAACAASLTLVSPT